MITLRVNLFGTLKVVDGMEQSEVKLTPTNQLLFSYLLLERHRFHSRDVLADLFWGMYNQERARKCLNTALWRLRSALQSKRVPNEHYIVTTHSGNIGFNTQSNYWLDLAVFEEILNPILSEPITQVQPNQIENLEKGISLYTGDLMEGIYEDWALSARETMRLLYIRGLRYLMGYYHLHKDFGKSLGFAQAILDIDPLREDIHRNTMRLYVENGQRSLAVRQYEICRGTLKKELRISPMAETRALYDDIMLLDDRQKLRKRDGAGNIEYALRQLQKFNKNIELAMQEFAQVVQILEDFIEDE